MDNPYEAIVDIRGNLKIATVREYEAGEIVSVAVGDEGLKQALKSVGFELKDQSGLHVVGAPVEVEPIEREIMRAQDGAMAVSITDAPLKHRIMMCIEMDAFDLTSTEAHMLGFALLDAARKVDAKPPLGPGGS